MSFFFFLHSNLLIVDVNKFAQLNLGSLISGARCVCSQRQQNHTALELENVTGLLITDY